jgi:isopenicillin N synthase-like dioxygenase
MNQIIQEKNHAAFDLDELGLPVFDLSVWKQAKGNARLAQARRFIAICQRHGFLYLIGHGVPDVFMSGLFDMSRRFFAQDMAEKLRISFLLTGGNSGYIPPSSEVTDKTTKGDLKESFAMGHRIPDLNPDLAIAEKLTTPNQWPDNVPGFRPIVEGAVEVFRDVAKKVLAITAQGLGGPEDFFNDKLSRPVATLRLNRYPTQDPSDKTAVGIGCHTDSECMSLLAQDNVGGLEVISPGGMWRDATPLPGALLFIVGEQLTHWTNGALKPTPHRVVNRAGSERYSANLFFTTDVDAPVGVIDGILQPGEEPCFPSQLAGDYVAHRIKEVYVRDPATLTMAPD